jgi:hypothetical protein
LRLSPLELLERLAALIPPPRLHRHRYHGVLAPNSPQRAQVSALAHQPAPPPPKAADASPAPARSPTRHLWALLLARIFEVFPLQLRMVRDPDAADRFRDRPPGGDNDPCAPG